MKLNCDAHPGLSANTHARTCTKCSNRFKTAVLFARVRFIPFCTTSALCPQDNSTEEPSSIVALFPSPPFYLFPTLAATNLKLIAKLAESAKSFLFPLIYTLHFLASKIPLVLVEGTFLTWSLSRDRKNT